MESKKTNAGKPATIGIPETDLKYGDLTRKVIGCAMEVHKILGNGFQEAIYQRALAIELNLQNISFHSRR